MGKTVKRRKMVNKKPQIMDEAFIRNLITKLRLLVYIAKKKSRKADIENYIKEIETHLLKHLG